MPTYAYVFTVNNYTNEDELAYQACIGTRGITYVIYGREIAPSTGTPHLQGYLQCNHKNTKRLNDALPCKKHVMAKGSYQQNYDYCTKGGDWVAFGDADQAHAGAGAGQGRRSDLAGVQEAINRGETYEEICETHFEAAAKYNRFIREQVNAKKSRTAHDSLRSDFENSSLYPWQQELVALAVDTPNPRKIHWIYEETGKVGKSWIANYLATMHNACVLDAGKKADLAYIYAQDPKPIVIIDLPRTLADGDKMDHLYNLAEALKNCRLTVTKYESKTIFFPCPTVIFFANFRPDLTKWSADRYSIKYVEEADIDGEVQLTLVPERLMR